MEREGVRSVQRNEKPGNRAKALASVIVDRIVGLYVLFLVALFGIYFTGLWWVPNGIVHTICVGVAIVTAIATIGIALVLVPGFLERFDLLLAKITKRVPKVGHAIRSLMDAIKIYRTKRVALFWTAVATVPVHTSLTISLYFLALGLGFDRVPCRDYFAIYPVSGLAGTIPVAAGPAEGGIMFFYKTAWLRAAKNGPQVAAKGEEDTEKAAIQQGLILALVYRLSMILVAPIGAAYYFLGARGEVSEVMHHLEDEDDGKGESVPG